MALLDFFRKLNFFAGRDTSGIEADDLDFEKWVQVHSNWRQRLTLYVDGRNQEELDEFHICRDDQCELGKWIHGRGAHYYGDVVVFQELCSRHAVFHRCAGAVVSCYKEKGSEDARRLLHREFDTTSMQIVQSLHALERLVKN